MQLEIIFIVILALWLAVVSYFLFKLKGYFKHFSKDLESGDLLKTLNQVLQTENVNKKHIKQIEAEINNIYDQTSFHLQKLGIVRFNPFSEMGGDHSFAVALLDGHDTGIIITGLHTRERTRVYVKPVKKGKSEYELSKEELKALNSTKAVS
jgi:hypothetical protein